jgi:hypothetical protein
MTSRRFPAPWHADPMPGGYVVRDANGQALAYLYSRDNEAEGNTCLTTALHRAPGSPLLIEPTAFGSGLWGRPTVPGSDCLGAPVQARPNTGCAGVITLR